MPKKPDDYPWFDTVLAILCATAATIALLKILEVW